MVGSSEFSLRIANVWLGVLTIPLTVQWGRMVGGRRVGLLAGLFMALSQSQVWLSQDVRSEMMLVIVCGLLATILLVQAQRRRRQLARAADPGVDRRPLRLRSSRRR